MLSRNDPRFWDYYFVGLAEYISKASKDPSTKVGAVIVRPDKTVASHGFNGFPIGIKDDPELYQNRVEKLKRIIHAEENALLFAKEDLRGYTLYLWPFPPCARCAGKIIQKGIIRVVSPYPTPELITRWGDDMVVTRDMFSQVNIRLDNI